MSKKGINAILLYILFNVMVYLLTLDTTYFLISVSLTTILFGFLVKFFPKFTGVKLKEKMNFYIMLVVGIGTLLLVWIV